MWRSFVFKAALTLVHLHIVFQEALQVGLLSVTFLNAGVMEPNGSL